MVMMGKKWGHEVGIRDAWRDGVGRYTLRSGSKVGYEGRRERGIRFDNGTTCEQD